MQSKDQYIQNQASSIVNNYNAGNFDEVIKKGLSLIKKYPNQFLFYNATSLALSAKGRFKDALTLLHEANTNFPNNIFIFNNLGLIYSNLNQNDDAKVFLNKALKINENHISALINLGNILIKEGNANEAKSLYDKALSLNPPKENLSNVYSALGNYYQLTGDFDNAEKVFEKLSKLDFNNTLADKQRSLIRKYKNKEDPHLKNMHEKLGKIKIDEYRQPLLFALGKAHEDIKDYNNSFEYLKEANDIANKKIGYDVKKDEVLFKNIKKFFDEYRNNYKSNTKKKIIFILGMPRSGTTLAEQIISSHHNVYGAGELPFLTESLEIFRKVGSLEKLNSEFIDKIKLDYLDKIKRFKYDEEFITDKSPLNFRWIGLIKLMFPYSKIIHCKRDAMDICFSNYKNSFALGSLGFSYNLENLGNYYKLYENLMKYWNEKFANEIYNLNYENLVENPKDEIEKILKFCQLEWDDNCLQHQNNKKIVATASLAQVRSPVYKSSVKKWKNFKEKLSDLSSIIDKKN